MNPLILALLILALPDTLLVKGIILESDFSQHSLRGKIVFKLLPFDNDKQAQAKVEIGIKLSSFEEQYAGEYSWGVYEYPIDYTNSINEHCHNRLIGRRPLLNLDEILEQKLMVHWHNQTANDIFHLKIVTDKINLIGDDNSIWGRSLVLDGPSRDRICSSIMPKNEINDFSFSAVEARFTSIVAGSVWFFTIESNSHLGGSRTVETKILTDLYHAQQAKSSTHKWKLFITDILTSQKDLDGNNCDFLQIPFDPLSKRNSEAVDTCSEDNVDQCMEGDLSGKHGNIKVGRRQGMFTRTYKVDRYLNIPSLSGPRSMFLVLYESNNNGNDNFLTCAKLRQIKPKVALFQISQQSVRSEINFKQTSPFHAVISNLKFNGLDKRAGGFHIHSFPRRLTDDVTSPCKQEGGHFNPFGIDKLSSPIPTSGSFDKYEVGDLSGKYGMLNNAMHVTLELVDPSLSLFGKYSIIGRSIVVHKSIDGARWLCSNILQTNTKMISAVATFTYPVAGRVIFTQDAADSMADTSIFVESLLYSDGSKSDTENHRWYVHTSIPGKDYYNWTSRCLSAGAHHNPFAIDLEDNIYNECINEHAALRCEVGDLVNKHQPLQIVGMKANFRKTTSFFTDTNLPLYGRNGIIGRSLVIHDDHAPDFRGNRMACTGIYKQYRHKAVAKQWYGNGEADYVEGRLEFIQDFPGAPSYMLIDVKNLKKKADKYHVHSVNLQPGKEFPCGNDVVGGHFNPLKVDQKKNKMHRNATLDQFEMGDLSGKFGGLLNLDQKKAIYNDSNLSLHGINSIVGRSIVIHKKSKLLRWMCSSLVWGYDSSEARQVSAIASFHHPAGFVWGFIRFRQVIYSDGYRTDTVIEVRLKYPGSHNRKRTSGHAWSVYVNPVYHDAAIEYEEARCSAAGYRWNPTLIQLADPNDKEFYESQCGPDYPLRCEVGDLTGRHGHIDIGGQAYIFNDENLQLDTGKWFTSALGKSIVIHGSDSGVRMACANIEADYDIIKFVSVAIDNRFSLSTFIEETRAVMGVPSWFIFLDLRSTKRVNGGQCLRFKVHFAGPYAKRLERDFSRLIRTGHQEVFSIVIPGYVPDANRKRKIDYRECRNDRPGLLRHPSTTFVKSSHINSSVRIFSTFYSYFLIGICSSFLITIAPY